MLLIPAIDLKNGCCVRLKQGDMNQVTIFSKDPVAIAWHWLTQGARRLHLVDLDGALIGKPGNAPIIKAILNVVRNFIIDSDINNEIPVQLGGGIRDLDTIEYYLDSGLSYVIIGTAAVKNPDFLYAACNAFPGKIIVGLDAKDGKIATDGWSSLSTYNVIDLAYTFVDYGCKEIIYTDILRDGMMNGINIKATVRLAQAVRVPIIASGGLHNIHDVEILCRFQNQGIMGVICGRSIYEGKLDLNTAQKQADVLSKNYNQKLIK